MNTLINTFAIGAPSTGHRDVGPFRGYAGGLVDKAGWRAGRCSFCSFVYLAKALSYKRLE